MDRSVVLLAVATMAFGCSSSSGSNPSGAGGAGGGSTSSHHHAGGGTAAGGGSNGGGGPGPGAGGGSASGPAGSGGATTTTSGSGGAGPACTSPLPEYTNDNGSVTFYTFSMGAPAVNCGFDVLGQNPDVVAHVDTGNGKYFGAMNTSDYANAAACGACVEVTRDGTKKVTVTIVDQCPTPTNPKCTAGHIDLSKEAFLQIGAENEGYLGMGNGGAFGEISWRYVACPVVGDVSYRLKEPTNQYWNQILVEEHRYAIAKFEAMVSGSWQPGVRQSYNYWQVGNGDLGQTPPYPIRVTDVNGAVITASLDLVAGDQTSSAQFPSCQ